MLKQPDCLAADLQSTLDAVLITAFHKNPQGKPIKVIEVGGGYGRLFETLSYVAELEIEYLLIDAVPLSLMFAYLYLKRHYPELKIGTPYTGDQYEPGKWDVFVMPSWHIGELRNDYFDLGINIDSFQEMNQFHVDTFVKLFDDVVRSEGTIYLSNSRDYRFAGTYNYPATWECKYMHRSPRSWTRHHPTEIFAKTTRDCSAQYRVHQEAYKADLLLAEILNRDIIATHNLRPVVPQAKINCTLRWPGPGDWTGDAAA
jgi:hypothetical protein